MSRAADSTLMCSFLLFLCFLATCTSPISAEYPLASSRQVQRALPRQIQGEVTLTAVARPLKEVLESVLSRSGLEWFLDKEVKGQTTVEFHALPWRQALQLILEAHGLYSRQVGPMLTIFPKDSDPSVAKAPVTSPVPVIHLEQVAVLPPYGLKLLGTVGPQSDRIAIVDENGESRMLRFGERLRDGRRVIQIHPDSVDVADDSGLIEAIRF